MPARALVPCPCLPRPVPLAPCPLPYPAPLPYPDVPPCFLKAFEDGPTVTGGSFRRAWQRVP